MEIPPTSNDTTDAPDTPPAQSAPRTGVRAWWTKMRRHWWFRWGTELGLFVMIFVVITSIQGWNLLGSGEAAPGFTLRDMQGKKHSLAQYEGKKTLLVFWAPWCGVCKVESSNVSAIHQSMGDDVHVVSVAVGYQGNEDLQTYIEEQEVDYPVLLGNYDLASAYAVHKYPTLYVIDEEGHIEHAEVGYTTELGMRFRLWF